MTREERASLIQNIGPGRSEEETDRSLRALIVDFFDQVDRIVAAGERLADATERLASAEETRIARDMRR